MLPKRRKPTHPGALLVEEFLKPLGWTPRVFAEKLGGKWNEVEGEAIARGNQNISERAAQDFASVLGTSAHFWLHLQSIYNQWEAIHRQNEKGSLKPWKKAQ